MAYTVLARKYRPQSFADLVGQEHVTRTLSNAITSDRVAHAFLFTGVRGVGKTTTARILAKALNCEKGPTPEPCGVCDACREITIGTDLDVLEMDGASNNSVEDVRRLQESIPYRPSRDRFKVVIVDEVHMLSTGAFNAFLKTLEEPPAHVKFIFATTEIHKVPITIRSRCQRYDFRLIPQSVVTDRVRKILAAESLDADDAAIAIVAREAAGSMRDALTLLDQIVAFGGAKLVGEEVARVLGIADRDLLHRVAEAVLLGDGAKALSGIEQIAQNGLDMLHFARQLLELVRDLVVLRVCGGTTDLVSMVDEERARSLGLAERVEIGELQRAFGALSRVVEDVAMSGQPRTTLEMGLVRLATRPPLRPIAELLAKRRGAAARARPPPARGESAAGPQPVRPPVRPEPREPRRTISRTPRARRRAPYPAPHRAPHRAPYRAPHRARHPASPIEYHKKDCRSRRRRRPEATRQALARPSLGQKTRTKARLRSPRARPSLARPFARPSRRRPGRARRRARRREQAHLRFRLCAAAPASRGARSSPSWPRPSLPWARCSRTARPSRSARSGS